MKDAGEEARTLLATYTVCPFSSVHTQVDTDRERQKNINRAEGFQKRFSSLVHRKVFALATSFCFWCHKGQQKSLHS